MISHWAVSCVVVVIGVISQAHTNVIIFPHTAIIAAGSQVEFECISDLESSSMRWHLQQEEHTRVTLDDSLEYMQITQPRDPSATISVLKIDDAERARDTGSYICSDDSGSSFTALLTVHDRPYLRMTSYPVNPVIDIGVANNITLYCDAGGEDVRWRKNGVDIDGYGMLDLDGDGDNDVHVLGNNTLVITGSDVTDAGLYNCYIEYTVDDVQLEENRTINIQVQVQVIGPNRTVYAVSGQTVTLQCTVYSINEASDHVVWVYANTGETVATIYPTGHIATAEGYGLDTTKPNRYDLIIYDVDIDGDYDCYFSQDVNPDGKVGTVSVTTQTTTGCNTGCIIGVSIGVTVVVCVIISILVWIWCLRRNRSNRKYGLRKPNKKDDATPHDVEMVPDITTIPRTRKQDSGKGTTADVDVCRVYKTPSRSISSPY